jgi:hypothetical protein
VDCPLQIEVVPETEQLGGVLAVTQALHELEQPPELVTVTVYVPAEFTVMQREVAPVLQE